MNPKTADEAVAMCERVAESDDLNGFLELIKQLGANNSAWTVLAKCLLRNVICSCEDQEFIASALADHASIGRTDIVDECCLTATGLSYSAQQTFYRRIPRSLLDDT